MALRFRFEIRITLLTLVVLPILMSLGFWQLGRAEEKREILAQRVERQQQAPVSPEKLSGVATEQLGFTPVQLRGKFDNQRILLLDNRVYESSVGFEVLQPFFYVTGNGDEQWALVNRGWVKAPASRDQLPEVYPAPKGEVTIRGEIYIVPGESYILEEQRLSADEWPQIIQTADIEKIADVLSTQLFPAEIRLKADDPAALLAYWEPVAVTPEKHVGYAVQWFAMSAVLIVWFVFANTNVWLMIRRNYSEKE